MREVLAERLTGAALRGPFPQWPGAAPPFLRVVCDEYLPRCFRLWDRHAESLDAGLAKMRSEL